MQRDIIGYDAHRLVRALAGAKSDERGNAEDENGSSVAVGGEMTHSMVVVVLSHSSAVGSQLSSPLLLKYGVVYDDPNGRDGNTKTGCGGHGSRVAGGRQEGGKETVGGEPGEMAVGVGGGSHFSRWRN